jgi:hypothetical protein
MREGARLDLRRRSMRLRVGSATAPHWQISFPGTPAGAAAVAMLRPKQADEPIDQPAGHTLEIAV